MWINYKTHSITSTLIFEFQDESNETNYAMIRQRRATLTNL
jgi:hypothetical protein